jgi:hypothetical protein
MRPDEKNDLKLFLELRGDVAESECEFNDNPDLRVPARSLGVEHTRILQYDPTIPEGRQKYPQEKLHAQLLQQAKQIFQRYSNQLLNLHAQFSEPFDSRRHHIDQEAQVLAQSVLLAVSRYPASETDHVILRSWEAQRIGLPFPRSLAAYIYNRVQDPAMALWAPGYSYMVQTLTLAEVEARIREKEGKLAAYRTQCQTLWLLLVMDMGTPSSHFDLPDALTQHRFPTLFDRLFLLLPFQRRLIELQVEHH